MNENFITYLKSEEKSEATIRVYVRNVGYFLDYVGKNDVDVTAMDVISWKESLISKGNSSATVHQYLASIKTYYDFLETIDLVEKNPVAKIKPVKVKNKEKHYMNQSMIQAMLDKTTNDRDYAIVLTFVTTGIRVGELINITLSQYEEMKNNGVNYIKTIGKGNKEHKVFFNAHMIEAINKYIRTFRNTRRVISTDKLFVSHWGGQIFSNRLSETLKTIARNAGIPFWEDICNHALRSACASILSDNGAAVATIRDVLNHASIVTTNRYIKTAENSVEDAIMAMNFA